MDELTSSNLIPLRSATCDTCSRSRSQRWRKSYGKCPPIS